jgi:hypothetical protein
MFLCLEMRNQIIQIAREFRHDVNMYRQYIRFQFSSILCNNYYYNLACIILLVYLKTT